MKYTKEQRLNIGKQIYENKLTKYEASIQYDISIDCARDYMRLYRNTNNLLPKSNFSYDVSITNSSSSSGLSEYETMSKEELIKEIIKGNL